MAYTSMCSCRPRYILSLTFLRIMLTTKGIHIHIYITLCTQVPTYLPVQTFYFIRVNVKLII